MSASYDWFESQPTLEAWSRIEQALLGGLLANPVKGFQLIDERLAPKHFADPLHAEIFGEMKRLYLENKAANPETLRIWWENNAEILSFTRGALGRQAVPPTYLADLLQAMVGVQNLANYAGQIVDGWGRREIARAMLEAVRTIGDPKLPIATVAGHIYDALTEPVAAASPLVETRLSTGVARVLDAMQNAQMGEVPPMFSSGDVDLDAIMGGGMAPGDLTVLGGRPGHGKSALALKMALVFAERYCQPVLYFSLEMEADDQSKRALSILAKVPADKITRGEVAPKEAERLVQAQRQMAGLRLIFDDRPRLDMEQIRMAVRRFRRTYGKPGMIVVDHMHLIRLSTATVKGGLGLVFAVGEIANQLKELAKDEKCVVLALAQLNRRTESADEKVPTMQDLKNSGDIEAAADVVLFTHRPELHLLRSRPTRKPGESDSEYASRELQYQTQLHEMLGKAVLVSGKCRRGPIGAVDRLFDGPTTSFSPIP